MPFDEIHVAVWSLLTIALLFMAPVYSTVGAVVCALFLFVVPNEWKPSPGAIEPLAWAWLWIGWVRVAYSRLRDEPETNPASSQYTITGQLVESAVPTREPKVTAHEDYVGRTMLLCEPLRLQMAELRAKFVGEGLSEVLQCWDADMLALIAENGCQVAPSDLIAASMWRSVCIDDVPHDEAMAQVEQAWERAKELGRLTVPNMFRCAAERDLAGSSEFTNDVVEHLGLFVSSVCNGLADDTETAELLSDKYQLFLLTYSMSKLLESMAEKVKSVAEDLESVAENVEQEHFLEVLGISGKYTREQLKSAYYRKVRQWHPDQLEHMAPELRAFATERLSQINAAYESLTQGHTQAN